MAGIGRAMRDAWTLSAWAHHGWVPLGEVERAVVARVLGRAVAKTGEAVPAEATCEIAVGACCGCEC